MTSSLMQVFHVLDDAKRKLNESLAEDGFEPLTIGTIMRKHLTPEVSRHLDVKTLTCQTNSRHPVTSLLGRGRVF